MSSNKGHRLSGWNHVIVEPTLVLVREPSDGNSRSALRARLIAILAVVAVATGLMIRSATAGPSFVERHRAEAEAYCRVEPEQKFRKYPLADGTDPAPHLDAFEWCVAAYISHLPAD